LARRGCTLSARSRSGTACRRTASIPCRAAPAAPPTPPVAPPAMASPCSAGSCGGGCCLGHCPSNSRQDCGNAGQDISLRWSSRTRTRSSGRRVPLHDVEFGLPSRVQQGTQQQDADEEVDQEATHRAQVVEEFFLDGHGLSLGGSRSRAWVSCRLIPRGLPCPTAQDRARSGALDEENGAA
jgi:hypothetical protein